jgi:phosphate transport system permease protein
MKKRKRDVHLGDRIFQGLLRGSAVLSGSLLLALGVQVFGLSQPAWDHFGWGFFLGTDWDPVMESFGALSFVYGTIVSSVLALLLAVPVSLGVALFLSELAPPRVASAIGFLVEMLAAVPSVIYGLWGIFVLAPLLRETVQPLLQEYLGFLPLFTGAPYGIGMMAAGIILGIMIVPTIASLAREVFRSIPDSQREAALGLGATRWEMIQLAVLRSSWPGVLGAVILGLGRALGETMAVTMVIGNRPDIQASLFAPGQTLASVIANEYAEATSDLHLASLAAAGLVLFVVSVALNALARLLVWKVKKGYASR